jgi:Dimerisation domain
MTTSSVAAAPLPTPADSRAMLALLGGYRISRALHVVTELGIADLLAAGPKSSDALALETKTHAATLRRVLRFLCGVGVFDEPVTDRFALTTLGAALRTDVQGSCQGSLRWLLGDLMQKSWPNLMHSVKTGETAFDVTYGMRNFDYLRTDAANSALFNASMTSNAKRSISELVEGYDLWHRCRHRG